MEDSDGRRSKISLAAQSSRKQWNRWIVYVRAGREKGNHEVTHQARGPVVAGWALAHYHQQQPEYAYIFMLFYIIDRRRGPRPRLSENRRHQPTTPGRVASVYDDDAVAAFPDDVTEVCAILFARVVIPLLPTTWFFVSAGREW